MNSNSDKILDALSEAQGADTWVSGEDIADVAGISRAAVWKQIEALREAGFEIEAQTRKGYRFAQTSDPITQTGVLAAMSEPADPELIIVKDQTTSTNDDLKFLAAQGAPEGTVVITQEQAAGKGRRGREFFSLGKSGLYMSLLVRPKTDIPASLFTAAAALVVAESLEEVLGTQPWIKWVNDVYLGSKKVSGILCEAATTLENASFDYVVIGIGLNVYNPASGFPTEIENRAGVISEQVIPGLRNRLSASIIDKYSYYYQKGFEGVKTGYKQRMDIIGREATVAGGQLDGQSVQIRGLDEDLGLLVKDSEGCEHKLDSAEISLKLEG